MRRKRNGSNGKSIDMTTKRKNRIKKCFTKTTTAMAIAHAIADNLDDPYREEKIGTETLMLIARVMADAFDFTDEEHDEFIEVALANTLGSVKPMPRYMVTVFERSVEKYEYEVEAESAEEAKQAALKGVYAERDYVHPRDQIEPQREVHGEPELIEE
jgi:hypothetical protein